MTQKSDKVGQIATKSDTGGNRGNNFATSETNKKTDGQEQNNIGERKAFAVG